MILTRIGPNGGGRGMAAITVVAALTLAACGSDSSDDRASDSPAIVATTSIWADVASQVACGADIPAVIPAGADPHSYEPSLRDRELLDNAAIVIANGLSLEEPLIDLLDTVADESDVRVLEVSIHVDVLVDDDGEHDDDHSDGDDHDDGDADADEEHADEEHADEHGHGADGDPHFWQDPRRVAGALDAIATAIASQGLPTCTDEYRDELLALDAEIAEQTAALPASSRLLVTSHDSLAYFADRYGFEIVGSVIPSTNTLAEASAAGLAELADEIERLGVPAVFTEALESTTDADALAERLGISIVPLVTDALLDDADADSYVEMMRNNATAIAEALAP
jgi:zinc/manganese transport system substrate-binding protein